MIRRIDRCRICSNPTLEPVLQLGEQVLTGMFPRTRNEVVPSGPLTLVACNGTKDACGLLQLQHSYDASVLYGENYGYRSGLNRSMVEHLHRKVADIRAHHPLCSGSLVIDIGSNDATTLRAYPAGDLTLVGIDPTGNKFRDYYPTHVELIADFFSANLIRDRFPGRKAAVVTSFSMFYDLERPLDFMREVADVLEPEGVWIFEQSYMPTMLARNSFDTICHEHLEYYGLWQVEWMALRAGLKLVDVDFNDVNGGSFSVTATLTGSHHVPTRRLQNALEAECRLGLGTLEPYRQFAARVARARDELRGFLADARHRGSVVAALGASTKGNVILQYCGVTERDVVHVGEVNEDKFGRFTPGSLLPIVPEAEVLGERADYLLVLPWHFRSYFATDPRFAGQTLVFPLPTLEVLCR